MAAAAGESEEPWCSRQSQLTLDGSEDVLQNKLASLRIGLRDDLQEEMQRMRASLRLDIEELLSSRTEVSKDAVVARSSSESPGVVGMVASVPSMAEVQGEDTQDTGSPWRGRYMRGYAQGAESGRQGMKEKGAESISVLTRSMSLRRGMRSVRRQTQNFGQNFRFPSVLIGQRNNQGRIVPVTEDSPQWHDSPQLHPVAPEEPKTPVDSVSTHERGVSSQMTQLGPMPSEDVGSAVHHFVKSPQFDYLSGGLVIVNAVFMGVHTDWQARRITGQTHEAFHVVEIIFCVLFASELLLRMWAYGRGFLVKKDLPWNLFDTYLVVSQVIEVILLAVASDPGWKVEDGSNPTGRFGMIRVLRILRLVRVMRLMRVLRLISELRTLVMSIVGSFKAFFWAILLLLMMMYVIGVYLTQVVLDHRLDDSEGEHTTDELIEFWGSVGDAVLSLYQSVTGGADWGDVLAPLRKDVSPLLAPCFMLYVAFAVLCMLNVITGVFVESALLTAKHDKDVYMVNSLRSLFLSADLDANGNISSEEFVTLLESNDMHEIFIQIDIDSTEASSLFQLLDLNRTGTIDVDEFIAGCHRLRGPAKSIDLCMLRREMEDLSRRFWKHAKLVERQLGCSGARRLTPTSE